MAVLPLLAFLLPLVTSVPVTFYKTCDSVGQVTSLDVTPCTGDNLCTFPRGQIITMRVTFTMPGKEITAAKPAVYAILGPLGNIPFPMEQDSCQYFDTPCPLAANTRHTYTTHVLVKDEYPTIRLVAEWQIRDQDDNTVICFYVPVEVV